MTLHVALVGHPLRRRHSEVMHNAAFRDAGLDATYELRDIPPEAVAGFVAETGGPGWLGFNVTAPYKQVVASMLDMVEPGAAAIGAVNSAVRRDDGTLVGFNTDALGFLSALEAEGVAVATQDTVVVGAGGAARAVVWALVEAGAASVTVANRSLDRAVALASDLGGPVRPVALDAPALAGVLASAALAVNATTMGMTTGDVAFDVARLDPGAFVFDLVYVPPETPLVQAARQRGLRVANGLEMLVRQGEIAFERWTGVAGMAEVMRAALLEWLPTAQAER